MSTLLEQCREYLLKRIGVIEQHNFVLTVDYGKMIMNDPERTKSGVNPVCLKVINTVIDCLKDEDNYFFGSPSFETLREVIKELAKEVEKKQLSILAGFKPREFTLIMICLGFMTNSLNIMSAMMLTSIDKMNSLYLLTVKTAAETKVSSEGTLESKFQEMEKTCPNPFNPKEAEKQYHKLLLEHNLNIYEQYKVLKERLVNISRDKLNDDFNEVIAKGNEKHLKLRGEGQHDEHLKTIIIIFEGYRDSIRDLTTEQFEEMEPKIIKSIDDFRKAIDM